MTGMSFDEAAAHVTATTPMFAITKANIRGLDYTVFQNTPPHLRALLQASVEGQDQGRAEYLVYGEERWTYGEFCNDVNRMAHILRDRFDVTPGARVAIATANCPEMMILLMAISSIGGVAVLLNAWWTTEELDYAIGKADLHIVFADGPRAERLVPLIDSRGLDLIGIRDAEAMTQTAYSALRDSDAPTTWPEVEIDPDADFVIMFSSGTTSHPKGVVLTHRAAINAVFSWLMQLAVMQVMTPPEPDDPPKPRPCVLIGTPLFHVTASHPVFLLSLPAGAKVVLMPKWDSRAAVEAIRDEEVTRFLGVPTQCADIANVAAQMGEPLPTLDYLGSGGAKRPAAQVAELTERFPQVTVATGWGMTETSALGIGSSGDEYVANPGAAGRLHPPVQELRFVDDDGQDVPQGEVGEITVKSPANMRCYLDDEAATKAALQDGWLRTGDLGYIDADGLVTIVDRKKNIVIRGGENIACLDVEGALHQHPAVAEACAFSVPHDRLGEVVGAGIQTREGHSVTAEELSTFLADHISYFKIPEHMWIGTDPLPRGATDKIDRRSLRATCLETLGASA